MKLLMEMDDPVLMQLLCDTLSAEGIEWRIDGGFSTAMLPGFPGSGLFTPRLMVAEAQFEAASEVMNDLMAGEREGGND